MAPSSCRPLVPLLIGLGLALVAFAPATSEAVPMYSTPGPAMADIDIGADGDVFAIGTDGYIYHWIKGAWAYFGGRGRRVAVDPNGHPWVIDDSDQIWTHNGSGWLRRSGRARAIDIGANGAVFILGQSTSSNGYVYRWNGTGWTYFGGSGAEITVDGDGLPWVVTGARRVFRHDGSRFNYISGEARDIDVGGDGTVYMLGGGWSSNGNVYHWTGTDWSYTHGYGVRIAVAPTGSPALINSGSAVWGSFVKRVHGDTTCRANERDCNVCAYDVRRQFDRLFSGHRDDRDDTWQLNWRRRYAPDYMLPSDAFDDGNLIAFKHVQGFVRTGSPTYPFAGSYSDDDDGSIFIIGTDAAESESLAWLHSANNGEHHPSGVHALGHYVGTIESGGSGGPKRLRLIDVDRPYGPDFFYDAPGGSSFITAGGGLGLARLGSNSYLAVTTNPGGGGNRVRSSGVFRIDGALGSGSITHLDTNPHQRRPEWGQDYRTAENVSLITECETGQVYAVHVSGDGVDGGAGHWRLERLEHGPDGAVLRGLKVYQDWQNINRCFLRAAGTAYAGDDHIIDLYCHEYDVSHEAWETWEGVDFVRREGRPLPSVGVLFPWYGYLLP